MYLRIQNFAPPFAHGTFICHRFAREPRWSETGDRYIIKLFRDYVFHQIDENNNPVVNLSHVLTCLNKACPFQLLDLLSPIMLIPRCVLAA